MLLCYNHKRLDLGVYHSDKNFSINAFATHDIHLLINTTSNAYFLFFFTDRGIFSFHYVSLAEDSCLLRFRAAGFLI